VSSAIRASHPARSKLRERFGEAPAVAVVLGSGLSGLVDRLDDVEGRADYGGLPGFVPSTVAGHPGRVTVGRWAGVRVALLEGRIHGYEGHEAERVVSPVRALAAWGTEVVVLTNAAGGIADDCVRGRLMLIEDHLNLTGTSPLVGTREGARFVDMTDAYDPDLRALLRRAAGDHALAEGVYAGLLGPQYETPAEVRMLRTLGASAVGMSTVLETIALRAEGVRVAGISCITNRAAGLDSAALDHEDVRDSAGRSQAELSRLIEGFLALFSGIASPPPTR
jgi:purine-nucleoside phosphorylase